MAGPCQAGARKGLVLGKPPAHSLKARSPRDPPSPQGEKEFKQHYSQKKKALLGGIGVLASIFFSCCCSLLGQSGAWMGGCPGGGWVCGVAAGVGWGGGFLS